MRRKYYFVIIIISLFVRCSEDMDSPKIDSYFPKSNSNVPQQTESLYIKFSEKMNKSLTEESVSISSKNHTPIGVFRWKENKLFYDLKEKLKLGHKYTICVTKKAEDIYGNNLKEDFFSDFYVGEDFINPTIIETYPTDGLMNVSEKGYVKITFSEAIKKESIENGFSIVPSVIGKKEFIDDKTFVFTPIENFTNKVKYTITLNSSILDASGNPLIGEKTFSFTVGNDILQPSLEGNIVVSESRVPGVYFDSTLLSSNTINYNIEKNPVILIQFSEKMEKISTSDSISFSPNVPYIYEWGADGTYVKLTLTDVFSIASYYQLSISDTAKDPCSNLLNKKYDYTFFINGQYSNYLFVENIYQQPSGVNPEIELSDEALLDLSAQYYYFQTVDVPDDRKVFKIKIIFNTDTVLPDMSNINFLDTITYSLEIYNGTDPGGASTPQIFKVEQDLVNKNIVIVHVYGLYFECYYKLKIAGGKNGIKDSKGNYLKTDFIRYFNSSL